MGSAGDEEARVGGGGPVFFIGARGLRRDEAVELASEELAGVGVPNDEGSVAFHQGEDVLF